MKFIEIKFYTVKHSQHYWCNEEVISLQKLTEKDTKSLV